MLPMGPGGVGLCADTEAFCMPVCGIFVSIALVNHYCKKEYSEEQPFSEY